MYDQNKKGDTDIVTIMKLGNLSWMSHVASAERKNRMAGIFEAEPVGRLRPPQMDSRKMGIKGAKLTGNTKHSNIRKTLWKRETYI